MPRYIDADALIEAIKNELWDWDSLDGITSTTVLKQTITDIQNTPAVDVVLEEYVNKLTKEISERIVQALEANYVIIPKKPVVRCKDCKWYDLTDPCGTLTPNSHRCKRVTRLWMEDDAYCSYGERREDE